MVIVSYVTMFKASGKGDASSVDLQKLFTQARWPCDDVMADQFVNVFVSSVANPDSFWVQAVTQDLQKLDEMNDRLDEYCFCVQKEQEKQQVRVRSEEYKTYM